jgi:hypothetical protein
MPKNNNTTRKSQAKNAKAGETKNEMTRVKLPKDYPALGFRRGKEVILEPGNADTLLDPTNLIAVRVGADVLFGHPYAIDEHHFALAQPTTVFDSSDVEVLGELVGV